MILSYWTLFVALSLSIVAAWYSIAGLTAIFAAAAIPIMIMGGIMEVAKITVTVWLHEYWPKATRSLKLQLTASVVLLMFITSMGIFGYLSKAHSDQSLVSGDVAAKIAVYDEKIKTAKDNIDANRKALKQMDEAVDQVMGRSSDEKGADKAVAIRRAQQKERARLQAEIAAEQKTISQLSEERAPIAAEVRKVEAEVGPIKYIAALIYGDNPDGNLLERAVRWVIIILVVVFDPLAIAMVLASTESLKWAKEEKAKTNLDAPDYMQMFEDRIKDNMENPAYQPDDGPLTDAQLDQIKELAKDDLPVGKVVVSNSLFDEPINCYKCGTELINATGIGPFCPNKNCSVGDGPFFDEESLESDKAARTAWKEQNPGSTLKEQRRLYEQGLIDQLPWEQPIPGTELVADNAEIKPTNTSFGTQFPDDANKGDVFIRVDNLPSRIFKFNGSHWIEIDKKNSDGYAYDQSYINHLIDKISTGEYDPELLSEAERISIEEQLKDKS